MATCFLYKVTVAIKSHDTVTLPTLIGLLPELDWLEIILVWWCTPPVSEASEVSQLQTASCLSIILITNSPPLNNPFNGWPIVLAHPLWVGQRAVQAQQYRFIQPLCGECCITGLQSVSGAKQVIDAYLCHKYGPDVLWFSHMDPH